ncbi:MAG TPA: hypothetical protein VNZ05_09285, partial [Solirubrobacteraceae bacterium]|nr:hypothetical protein [Solirubrobacteraceae bacterium]
MALLLAAALLLTVAAGPRAALGAARRVGALPVGAISVRIADAPPGARIPQGFLGFSLETPALHSPAIVSPSSALVALMRALGPGQLRISGVSVDRTQWMGVPETAAAWQLATIAPSDLRSLATLMSDTGWKLLLGINLGHPATAAVVEEGRAASALLGSSLAGVALGNEPDLFTRAPSAPFRAQLGSGALRPIGWGLESYEGEISALRAALGAAGVAVPLYGPDTASSAWLEDYAADQGAGLAALAQHFYPLDRCFHGRLLRSGPSFGSLLSARIERREALDLAAFVRIAQGHGLPPRVDEANSVACAGQVRTSSAFASALWAIDFSLIAAREGIVGVNFHGGLGSCRLGGTITSPWYSPLCTLPDGQLRARPEYYALLLLRSLEGGSFVPITYATGRRIVVYALRAPDGSLRVVIDDMELARLAHSRGRARLPTPVWVALRA